jgi:hypothetical protein
VKQIVLPEDAEAAAGYGPEQPLDIIEQAHLSHKSLQDSVPGPVLESEVL